MTSTQAHSKVPWNGGPSTRGSLDILWACLSTLALCVWTAVHPNVLPASSSAGNYYQRAGMMILAIIFPEVIISAAWTQLRMARNLCSEVNKIVQSHLKKSTTKVSAPQLGSDANQALEQTGTTLQGLVTYEAHVPLLSTNLVASGVLPEPGAHEAGERQDESRASIFEVDDGIHGEKKDATTGNSKHVAWKIQQGFYAIMGGYAVNGIKLDPKTFSPRSTKRILTSDGILELARAGLLPTISMDDIEERSKADIFAKIIVLSQVIWFAVQVLSRLIVGLTVSPLETHTAVHVGCTILIYVIWLKKPYDITRPFVLNSEPINDLVAFFTLCEINHQMYARRQALFENENEKYWKDRLVRTVNNILDYDPPPSPPMLDKVSTLISQYTLAEVATLPAVNDGEAVLNSLAPAAQRAITRFQTHSGYSPEVIDTKKWDCLRDSSENFRIRAVWGGWSTNTGHEMSMDKAVHLLFNLIYGGAHLCLWASSSFPTTLEQWIWRASGIVLAAVPVWGCLWILWWKAVGSRRKIFFLFRNGDLDIVAGPFFFVTVCAYILARCYFLVESLASLRLLPQDAYRTVNWVRGLPHAS